MVDCADRIILTRPLHDMFTTVPHRYDLVNHIITWGLDKRWRREAATECLVSQPKKLLDLCCGTGDLAINLSCLAENDVEITAVDYSQPMLNIATKKAGPVATKPLFVSGDAASLPFPNGYFDCVGTSFAFRNLTYKNPLVRYHISEVLRVLKPGGRFVIVESSQPKVKLIRKLFHLYLRLFVFRIGTKISGNRRAYHYLAESAARFHTAGEINNMLGAAGFHSVLYRPLFWGVAGIHVAIK